MAVPKKKTSKGKRNQRRSHHALKQIQVMVNPVTGEYQLPHHICASDGTYKGRKVVVKNNQEPVEA